jgi:uncharacterized protein YdaU (DUF1376 family)
MQLYVSDFVGDTLMLSAEHVGVYMLLLIALWNAKGSLPNDDVKLARVARMSLKKWRYISGDLLPFFEVADGRISHHRLMKELQKSDRQSQSRASAGAKGGAAKALKYNNAPVAKGVAMLKHLPEPYRKRAPSDLKEGQAAPAEAIRLDRYADEALFKACEAITGDQVPEYQQFKSFPAEVVAKARSQLTGTARRDAAA